MTFFILHWGLGSLVRFQKLVIWACPIEDWKSWIRRLVSHKSPIIFLVNPNWRIVEQYFDVNPIISLKYYTYSSYMKLYSTYSAFEFSKWLPKMVSEKVPEIVLSRHMLQ